MADITQVYYNRGQMTAEEVAEEVSRRLSRDIAESRLARMGAALALLVTGVLGALLHA